MSGWTGNTEEFWDRLEQLYRGVQQSKAIHINSRALRDQTYDLAQLWFRSARPDFIRGGVTEQQLSDVDTAAQQLLRLSTGRNTRAAYMNSLRVLRRARADLEARLAVAAAPQQVESTAAYSLLEQGIINTLDRMLPVASLSYRQVLHDVSQTARYSYRGTATELRECVRELLDHLAPDSEVMNAPGFKLEKERRAPTMKQKARFILKARGVGESSRTAPEQAVQLLEDQIASIVRSVYERGSASTHGTASREMVLSFKGYADAVLSELLQLHRR